MRRNLRTTVKTMSNFLNNSDFVKKYTLVFVKNGENLLLGMKKRGFGVGKWNGYGGKVEGDETILKCAIRELKEESNLNVKEIDMKYLGYVEYERVESPFVDVVYIFTTNKVNDDLKETEEMAPKWFGFHEIPYDCMWPDSKYWLPIVLKNECFLAKFLYNDQDEIKNRSINLIDAPKLKNNDHI